MIAVGTKWKAVINGRKAQNGKRYSATITGSVTSSDEESSLYSMLSELGDHLAEKNREMELPDSLQITIYPVGGAL